MQVAFLLREHRLPAPVPRPHASLLYMTPSFFKILNVSAPLPGDFGVNQGPRVTVGLMLSVQFSSGLSTRHLPPPGGVHLWPPLCSCDSNVENFLPETLALPLAQLSGPLSHDQRSLVRPGFPCPEPDSCWPQTQATPPSQRISVPGASGKAHPQSEDCCSLSGLDA